MVKVTRLSKRAVVSIVAVVAGVGEPVHDRAQALRHAGGRVADAVVVDEEEPHN